MAKRKETAFRPQNLVEAKMSLDKAGYDLIDIVLGIINEEPETDYSNLRYEIRVADYANLMGLKHTKNVYRKMAQACEVMEDKGFDLYQSKDAKKHKHYTWFPMIDYDEERQSIILEVHRDTKAMLVSAKINKEPITYYGLRYVLPMKSQYAKRIYYMCKEWVNSENQRRFDTVEDLRQKLDVPQSYRYGMFKKSVLDKAVAEINELSDIEVTYSETYEKGRGGTKVVGLVWDINKKAIAESSQNRRTEQAKESFAENRKQSKNRFNNFEQQRYDIAELEQQLLSN